MINVQWIQFMIKGNWRVKFQDFWAITDKSISILSLVSKILILQVSYSMCSRHNEIRKTIFCFQIYDLMWSKGPLSKILSVATDCERSTD